MGYLKMILNNNNAEGIREAMRITYQKSVPNKNRSNEKKSHYRALFLALHTRNMTINPLETIENTGKELIPFLHIDDQETAIETLAEYVVYKERPLEVRYDNLKRILNNVFREQNYSSDQIKRIWDAFQAKYKWLELLDSETIELIDEKRDINESSEIIENTIRKSREDTSIDSKDSLIQIDLIVFYTVDIIEKKLQRNGDLNEVDIKVIGYLYLKGIELIEFYIQTYYSNVDELFKRKFIEKWANKYSWCLTDLDRLINQCRDKEWSKYIINDNEKYSKLILEDIMNEYSRVVKVQIFCFMALKGILSEDDIRWLNLNIKSTYNKA